MIRPLRRRHRAVITSLALLLPVGLVASFAVRPPEPAVDRLPAGLGGGTPVPACSLPLPEGAWGDLPLEGAVASVGDGGARTLWLRAVAPIRRPDLLVYWSPRAGAGTVDDAFLLGPLAAGTVPLPLAARGGGGRLLVYSLGHGERIGSAGLPPLPEKIPCR